MCSVSLLHLTFHFLSPSSFMTTPSLALSFDGSLHPPRSIDHFLSFSISFFTFHFTGRRTTGVRLLILGRGGVASGIDRRLLAKEFGSLPTNAPCGGQLPDFRGFDGGLVGAFESHTCYCIPFFTFEPFPGLSAHFVLDSFTSLSLLR